MKLFIMISICINIMSVPTKANTDTTYLIYGDMPSYILLTVHEEDEIEVLSLPATLIVDASCTTNSSSLQAIATLDTNDCLKNTIQKTFSIDIDHTIDLHTTRIDQEYPQYLKGSDLESMECITSYFEGLSDMLDISMLWNYQNYLTTDLSLWDMKDLFPMFVSDDIAIAYRYPHLIGNSKHWYILDKQLYKQ